MIQFLVVYLVFRISLLNCPISEISFGFNFFRTIFNDVSHTSILHMVQMARIFPDSKTFVDMKIRQSPSSVLLNFNQIMAAHNNNPPKHVLAKFVSDNFTHDNQMELHDPSDWTPNPSVLAKVPDQVYKDFASDLNQRWKILGRKISQNVEREPDLYSLIYLPHPVIVPGGRFGEIYYWDTYWIIRGLLLCDMYDTVKGLLLNFVHLIRMYGKIPNGGRTYFINRSQPPLFIKMVSEYVKASGDMTFLKQVLPYMVQEFEYWLSEHFITVNKNGRDFRMARFNCEDSGPRPESYVEDFMLTQVHCDTVEEREKMYHELKTGAETGWDYSTRWMISENGDNDGRLEDVKPRYILPVDLNAFLAQNARLLAEYLSQNDPESAKRFNKMAIDLEEAIEAVMWHEEDGVWYDYDLINHKPRPYFTPSNLVPLWTGSYSNPDQAAMAVKYLIGQGLERYPGGVPTSLSFSEQQWDFPNCWPPSEHMLVVGLENTGLSEAKDLAFQIAERRVRGALTNFIGKGHMFEKYNCESVQKVGGGGEYENQIGFGWSNGVVLDFLQMYGAKMRLQGKNLNELINQEEAGEI